jgi:hypothetical protein
VKARERDHKGRRREGARHLSLHPLSVEDALRGAIQTGRPAEPDNNRTTREMTKRQLTKKTREAKGP